MADLNGCRVLLVEDEYLIAHDLCTKLEDVGAVVIGPEPSVQRALRRVVEEAAIDVAVLDINLGGEKAFPVADALNRRDVPFVFSSGYGDDMASARYPDVIKCDKPLDMRILIKHLAQLIATNGRS